MLTYEPVGSAGHLSRDLAESEVRELTMVKEYSTRGDPRRVDQEAAVVVHDVAADHLSGVVVPVDVHFPNGIHHYMRGDDGARLVHEPPVVHMVELYLTDWQLENSIQELQHAAENVYKVKVAFAGAEAVRNHISMEFVTV